MLSWFGLDLFEVCVRVVSSLSASFSNANVRREPLTLVSRNASPATESVEENTADRVPCRARS